MAHLLGINQYSPHYRPLIPVLVAAALVIILQISTARAADKFSFLVVSDLPYTEGQNETLNETIIPTMLRSGVPFLIHLGDIKSGGAPCTNRDLLERRDQVYSMHQEIVFYTPGDNEWTDCDREELSERFSELDRLELVRQLFYSKPLPLSAEWRFSRQPLYPENMRWAFDNVVFSTLHIAGTSNGRRQILMDDIDLALLKADARDRAAILWMEETFELAREQNAPALVIAIHADITKSRHTEACSFSRRQDCDPFALFKQRLRQLSAAFKRPVLLMHGDTQPYCLDKGFGGPQTPNLWRFDSAGDYAVIDAIKVTFNPHSKRSPFSFISLVQGIEPEECA
ncbi:MAG: metallophosphoesterase [Proteobacteria bacterium]|nr:metallophosphoesterase [Pseudomonadota bacterium]